MSLNISDQDLYRGLLATNNGLRPYDYSDDDIDRLVTEDITVSYAEACLIADFDMDTVVRLHQAGVSFDYLLACIIAERDAEYILEAHAAGVPIEYVTA